MATTEDSRADREFRRFLTWTENIGGLDKQMRQSRGDVGAYDTGHPEMGIEYFSVNAEGEEGAGLYDDSPGDYHEFPWAYREHPDYRKYWGSGNAYVGFIPESQPFIRSVPKEMRQSVLSTLGSKPLTEPLTEDINQSFVSRDIQDKLNASTQSALQEIKKDPSLPFVGAARQGLLGDKDKNVEPFSSPLANRLISLLEQKQQQRVQDSPERRQAIANILQTDPTFLSRQLQQVTSANVKQTEPKFTNILEETETDPVETLTQSALREASPSFVQVIESDGFDEDSESNPFGPSVSVSSIMAGSEEGLEGVSAKDSAPFAAAEGRGNIFADMGLPNITNPFTGGTINTAKHAQTLTIAAANQFGKTLGPFGSMITDPVASLITGKDAEEVAKDVVTSVGKAAITSLTNPLFAAPLMAAVQTGMEVAAAEEEGVTNIGGQNIVAGFFGNLTGGLIGDSIATQVTEQNMFEEEIEDAFSLFGKTPKEGWGIINHFKDDWNLKVKEESTQKEIMDQINAEIARSRYNEYQEKELDIAPGGGGGTGAMGPGGMAHSFGDPHDTGLDDTYGGENGDGTSGGGSDAADAATDSDASGDSW